MKLVSHQRITLLKNTQASAASVFFMGVFFSPDQAEFFSSQFSSEKSLLEPVFKLNASMRSLF